MKLNKEQLTFFCSEVLYIFGWCEEIAKTGVDPLVYVRDEVSGLRRHIKRLEKSLEMRSAAEQSMHQTGLGLCEEEGCKQPAVVGYCSEHF